MIPSPIHFSHGTNGPPKLFLQCSAPQLFVLFYSLQFLEKTFNRHYIVQKQCISMLNKSNIPSRHSLFQAFEQWIVLRGQRTGKSKKEERDRGETHPPTLSHPLTVFFFFSAHISLHHPHDSNIAFPPPPPGGLSYLAKTWVCQLVPNEQDMVYSVYMVLESFFTIQSLDQGLFFGPAAS